MKRSLAILLGAGLLAGSPALYSQQATASPTVTDQDIQLMRKDLQSDKKLILAANMVLTDAEAQKFWPVYDQYAADLAKVNDTKLAVVKDYAANVDALSDAKAEELARRWTEADSAAIQLRLKYLSRLQRVLPGTKVARFFQLDRRIGLVMDLQVASEIPLVSQ